MSSAKRKSEETASATEVDLGPLRDSVGYLLRRAQIAVFQRFFDVFAEFDIHPAQYSTLTVIQRNPGLSQTRLANALGIKKTNLVAMINALEARGLARRKSTDSDRRSHALYLTKKGIILVGRLHQQDALLNRSVLRSLSKDDRVRLSDVLRQLARH